MAKGFKLQSVLKHRGLLEDLARQRLAETLSREQALRAEMDRVRSGIESLQVELCQRQMHGISVQDLLLYEAHIDHRGKQIAELKRQTKRTQDDVAGCRMALCQASQDKQLLENLKDKKMAEHRRLLHAQETRQLDEIALQVGNRKQ